MSIHEAKVILDAAADRLLRERVDSHTCPICKRTWHHMPYPICFNCRTDIIVDATGMPRPKAEYLSAEAVAPFGGALHLAIKNEHTRQQRAERARNRKASLRDLERVMYVLDGFSSMQVAKYTGTNLAAVRGTLRGAAGREIADVLLSLRDQLRPKGDM